MKEYEILLEMADRLDEVQQDLFQSGFCSVPESACRSLSELQEEAAGCGMVCYARDIAALLECLEQSRHSLHTRTPEVMEAYVELYEFNRRLKRRLMRDMLLQETF